MRARDFIREYVGPADASASAAADPMYKNVASVLDFLLNKIKQGGMQNKVLTSTIINMVQHSGLESFSKDDLVHLHEIDPAIKQMLKTIDGDIDGYVKFNTGDDVSVDDSVGDASVMDNPQNTVSQMAKSALAKRT